MKKKVCLLLLIMGIIFCGCSGNGKTTKAQDDNDSIADTAIVDTTSDDAVSESDETYGRVVAPSPEVSADEEDDEEDDARDVTTTDGEAVYICTGGYSKRYHFDRFCSGLSNCRGEIEAVSVEEAEDEGRTPCHKCAY